MFDIEIPCKQRKYILRIVDMMKRGLISFEYLERRMYVKPCRKLTKPTKKVDKKKKDDKK